MKIELPSSHWKSSKMYLGQLSWSTHYIAAFSVFLWIINIFIKFFRVVERLNQRKLRKCPVFRSRALVFEGASVYKLPTWTTLISDKGCNESFIRTTGVVSWGNSIISRNSYALVQLIPFLGCCVMPNSLHIKIG